jgi:hypothetical protein
VKPKKTIKGAEAIGVNVKQDKSLDKLSGMVLFPDKLKEANKVVSRLKWNA